MPRSWLIRRARHRLSASRRSGTPGAQGGGPPRGNRPRRVCGQDQRHVGRQLIPLGSEYRRAAHPAVGGPRKRHQRYRRVGPRTSPSAPSPSPATRSACSALATGTSARSARAVDPDPRKPPAHASSPPRRSSYSCIDTCTTPTRCIRPCSPPRSGPAHLSAPTSLAQACARSSRAGRTCSPLALRAIQLGNWPQNTAPWTDCAGLMISPTTLQFGQVPIRTTLTRTIGIRNTPARALPASPTPPATGRSAGSASTTRWPGQQTAPHRLLSTGEHRDQQSDRHDLHQRIRRPLHREILGKGAGGFPIPTSRSAPPMTPVAPQTGGTDAIKRRVRGEARRRIAAPDGTDGLSATN